MVTWKRKEGAGSETALSDGEAVSGGVLTVSANKLTGVASGLLTYLCYVNYADTDTGIPVNVVADITFTTMGAIPMRSQIFHRETIRRLLKNEVYVGDKLLQKEAPTDFFTKRSDTSLSYDSFYLQVESSSKKMSWLESSR